ncbi:MAG: hypothetical protein ASARMPREDX12_003221 [Alectoria sarmentosa]|nr:MAG: hypothetical protein ASARMPREDX12_003221 [Alectoria sarmentosa]
MVQLKDSHCDLLITGAGPAGLMAALWAARCGIHARIVDKRGTKIFNGQADGLQCRSLEIFDSFGFADRVWKESNHMLEICLWNPDETGRIRRTDRIPDTIPGISRFQQVVLHQGRIERFFLDSLKEHSHIKIERGVLPEQLEIDHSKAEDDHAYPIKVKIRHLDDDEATPAQNGTNVPDGLFRSSLAKDDTDDLIRQSRGKEGTTELIHAKYMIGCDGAHSWTRRQLGFQMQGEQTEFIWGVLDIVPITNFPDIRMRCAIHSAESGSVMIIPRENKLVRFYIQLTEVNSAGKQVDRSKITPEIILKAARKIMSPYQLAYDYCDWWTAYQIGQRVGNLFSCDDRVFLAGDAVHTHSPKAGQGMNVSMHDTYNLGWKIGLVVKGLAKRSILRTYQSERRRIAQDLIAFDHRFSHLFSGRPARDAADEAGISMAEFKDAFEKGNMFASGLAVDYGASILVAKPGDSGDQGDHVGSKVNGTGSFVGKQELASNIKLGMRFPSFQVLNQSDARPWHFGQFLKSDGRFRIIVFAGNLQDEKQSKRLQCFGESLAKPESVIRRFTPTAKPIDSVIEILVIHSAPRQKLELLDLHEIFHPFDEKRGWDYEKVFVDDVSYHEGHGEAYKNYGVDKESGCVAIARPDQHVGWIGELEDLKDIDRYFSEVLIAQV